MFAQLQGSPELEALWDGFRSIDPDTQAKVLQARVLCLWSEMGKER